MPRVKELPDRGVHVTGAIRDLTGKPVSGRGVTVSLPTICTWRGKIILTRQHVASDREGKFEFWLPPSSELQPTDKKIEPPDYDIMVENLGTWSFRVPDGVLVMRIGEVKHGHEDQGGKPNK